MNPSTIIQHYPDERRVFRVLLLNSAKKWIGEAAHVFDLYRELEAAGHSPILACKHGSELEQQAIQAGYRMVAMEFESGLAPIKDLRDIRQIRRIIRGEKIDIVHAHRGKDHWLAAAAIIGFHNHVALVRTRHVVMPAKGHWPNRWLYRSWTDFVLSVSAQVQAGLGPLLPLIPESCRKVVYSSVNLQKFHPAHRSDVKRTGLGIGQEDLLIGLIGRFQNIKGQHIFLQSAKTLAKQFPQARFLVAGRSREPRRMRYARAVEKAGLTKRFTILGYQNDLPTLLASMDIGVVASLGSEGSSRIALECLASGVPVVATTVGGIPELLQHGRYGILVKPNDAESLADGIARMIEDEQLRKRLQSEGRVYVESEKHYGRWIMEIEQAYQKALDRRRR